MNRTSFFVATICTIVQYYDYHLFGFLAARLSKHFFSGGDPVYQLMKTYALIAIAVMAKPIGALILGRIGDIYGRFTTVIISLSGTAMASFVIALTPSYEQIGVMSAIILLFCRMCIATLVSSGTDGIRIYVYEKIRADKQCLGNGIVAGATHIGSFIASLSAWFFTLDYMPNYSWRFAFLLGTFLGFGAIYLRTQYFSFSENEDEKDPEYETYKNKKIYNIVSANWELFCYSALLAGCIGSTYQFIIIFFGTYTFEVLKLVEHSRMQLYISIGVVVYMIFSVIGGLCADFFGRLLVANIASCALVLITLIFTLFISYDSYSLSMYFSILVLLPFVTMPALTLLKQSIPKVIRYRLFSLAHACGSIVISAPTASVGTYLYYSTSISWLPMVYFLATIIIMAYTINKLTRMGDATPQIK